MRIGLVAPPFIEIPPKEYGGTELFIGNLAAGLGSSGVDVVLYTNGESTLPGVEKRWLYEHSEWPITSEIFANLKDLNHAAWAIEDAIESCDIIHMNNASGLAHSRFVPQPFVYTMHHPYESGLASFYGHYPETNFVCISDFQRSKHELPNSRTIHHGIDMSLYRLQEKKQDYVCFLGRIAPVKGTHLAIEVAKRSGVPLKIAGQVQPMFQDYFDTQIKPHIDGKFIEYIGEADLKMKNDLLGNALAMLFPIDWDEPFGLVLVESMACGTPVLALPGGSVPEIVRDGISGYLSTNIEEMAKQVQQLKGAGAIPSRTVRQFAVDHFSVDRMVAGYVSLYQEILRGRGVLDESASELESDTEQAAA